jgi:hypothetical protein
VIEAESSGRAGGELAATAFERAMLAAGRCGGCRFVDDAGLCGVHFSFLKGALRGTPRVICVNAVDKGDRSRFGVKAVDKRLTGNLKSGKRNSRRIER